MSSSAETACIAAPRAGLTLLDILRHLASLYWYAAIKYHTSAFCYAFFNFSTRKPVSYASCQERLALCAIGRQFIHCGFRPRFIILLFELCFILPSFDEKLSGLPWDSLSPFPVLLYFSDGTYSLEAAFTAWTEFRHIIFLASAIISFSAYECDCLFQLHCRRDIRYQARILILAPLIASPRRGGGKNINFAAFTPMPPLALLIYLIISHSLKDFGEDFISRHLIFIIEVPTSFCHSLASEVVLLSLTPLQ